MGDPQPPHKLFVLTATDHSDLVEPKDLGEDLCRELIDQCQLVARVTENEKARLEGLYLLVNLGLCCEDGQRGGRPALFGFRIFPTQAPLNMLMRERFIGFNEARRTKILSLPPRNQSYAGLTHGATTLAKLP